jgi:hypothetical protein
MAQQLPDLLLAGRMSGAEVRDRRGTADALDPDVLDPGDVRGDVAGGDDHLRGEGLVVAITGALSGQSEIGPASGPRITALNRPIDADLS